MELDPLIRYTGNNRQQKTKAAHNRKPGAASRGRTMRNQLIRREVARAIRNDWIPTANNSRPARNPLPELAREHRAAVGNWKLDTMAEALRRAGFGVDM